VVATQGRSFWILDDLNVLHQMAGAASATDAYLFKPEETYRLQASEGFDPPATATLGKNPPNGASIHYYLKNKPTGQITMEFLDSSGRSIKKFTSKVPEPQPQPSPAAGLQAQTTPGAGAPPQVPPEQPQAPSGEEVVAAGNTDEQRRIPAEAGLNRFVWDLRHADAAKFPGMILWAGETRGPLVVPGTYQVRLTVNGKTMTESFEVRKDPRISTTPADFAKQFDLLIKIRDKLTETHNSIARIREVRRQTDDLVKRVKDGPGGRAILEAAKSLNDKLRAVEEQLYQTKNQSSQDPLNYPIRLNNKLAALAGVVAGADAAPTDPSYVVYEEQVGLINAQLRRLEQIMTSDLAAFNRLVREQNIPAVITKP
jgi:hypothetical protein